MNNSFEALLHSHCVFVGGTDHTTIQYVTPLRILVVCMTEIKLSLHCIALAIWLNGLI